MLRKLNDEFHENLSRSTLIDAAARRLRNTGVEHESRIPRSTDEGLDLWEADVVFSKRYRDTRNKIVFVNPACC